MRDPHLGPLGLFEDLGLCSDPDKFARRTLMNAWESSGLLSSTKRVWNLLGFLALPGAAEGLDLGDVGSQHAKHSGPPPPPPFPPPPMRRIRKF